MDAIEFIKQLRRMDEKGVPKNRFIYLRVGRETDSPEDVVAEVEEWAKMNPVRTRQSVFLEQWPEAEIDTYGYLMVCPKRISADCRIRYRNCSDRLCSDCRPEFWMQEVE
jgi:hypothetical protein